MSETPSATVICSGFTTAVQIAFSNTYQKISKTSFSVTLRKAIIQSQGTWYHASGINSFNRTKGPYIHDVPVIECSLTFEASKNLITSIFQFITSNRNNKIKVKLTDKDSGIDWEFKECYLQSLSFSVSKNSILSVSLNLFVRTDEVNYQWSKRTSNAQGNDTTLPLSSDDSFIPYYTWKITSGSADTEIDDIVDFSFSYTQNITPKYMCIGSSGDTAPAASHLIFGLPMIEFSLTQLIYKAKTMNYTTGASGTNHVRAASDDLNKDYLNFYIMGVKLFTLYGITEIEHSPVFEDTMTCKTTYSVNGKITV